MGRGYSMSEQEFPDLSPCAICNKPAKTIRDDNGKVIMFGMHRICAAKIKVEEGIPERLKDN